MYLIGYTSILQGGFSTNMAPAKLVGKLLNLFDSTAHRVVGGLPPPAPTATVGSFQGNENYTQSNLRVSSSQSTMAISTLMPSTSMEPISQWTADDHSTMPNRSVSEPDIGRTPTQVSALYLYNKYLTVLSSNLARGCFTITWV